MKWSQYQQDIFSFIQNAPGNAIIEAVAGSGKTTTIVEAIKLVPHHQSTIFLAFNKSIAEELKSRGVNARTFHSLCAPAAFRHTGATTVSGNKLSKLMYKEFPEEECFRYAAFVMRLVSLAKQVGMGVLVKDTVRTWEQIIDHHNLELETEDSTQERAIELAQELLKLSNASNLMDFDDMLYLPILFDLKLPTFFFVFVDEAQDTNGIQRAVLHKIMGRNSRLVAVGDPAQAIYGFRGADNNSLNRIAKQFNCTRLPLSVSYRCATSIIDHATKWVDHILPREGAPAGQVVSKGNTWDIEDFVPSDLVLCRTTKPLIQLAFKMLRNRISVTIMGRDIGAGLVRMIRKMKARDLDDLADKVDVWLLKETQKAIAKMDESKAAAIEDKASCLNMLIDSVKEEDGTINSLINTIEDLFTPTRNSTTLATIHKSKGLEADTVYWLNSSQCPSKWARQRWQKEQEYNLCYVATTRAKNNLFLIEMD